MPKLVKAGTTTAAKKRLYFFCVDAVDGLTPEVSEAGGQPQISTDGGAFTNTGIGVLSAALATGWYYGELTDGAVDTAGRLIEGRYKSANTAEALARSPIQVVAFDPDAVAGLGLTNLDATVTSRLAPTVAARTLDVSTTGEAGVDWANVGSPTTAVNLSGTNIKTDQAVASVSGNVTGSVGSVAGNVTGSVGSVASYGTLVADTAAAVWAIATTTLTGTGTIGKFVMDYLGKLTGITYLANWLRLLMNKGNGDATARQEARALGGTFDETTDSLQGLYDLAPGQVWEAMVSEHTYADSFGDLLDNAEDTLNAAKAVTDKVDDTLEDNSGTYRFTTNALENAPSGTGSSPSVIAQAVADLDFTDNEETAKEGATWGDAIALMRAIVAGHQKLNTDRSMDSYNLADDDVVATQLVTEDESERSAPY
jgi:hypothetical protein